MKTIKVLLVLAILVCSNTIYAINSKKNDTPNSGSISLEIKKVLKHCNLEFKEDISADVHFTINSKNEIVVLSIESDSEELENYIKTQLNYRKLDAEGVKEGKKYFLPIKLIAVNHF